MYMILDSSKLLFMAGPNVIESEEHKKLRDYILEKYNSINKKSMKPKKIKFYLFK